MDNPETRTTLGEQDSEEWTTQRHGQHWVNKTAKNGQPRDTDNTETRTRLGEQDTEERQTKQKNTEI
jgi:hypothetical protein